MQNTGGPPAAERERAREVFVVHGRNEQGREAMFTFLRSIGLYPIEWAQAIRWTGHASPYIGQVLDTAFDRAQAVIVLMTPDEIAYLQPAFGQGPADRETQPAAQARPNVLFEAGMAMGRDAQRTVLVELGVVRPFSDVAGRHAVRLTNDVQKRKDLAQRLQDAGCAVDLSGTDWLTAGDFTPPSPPGGGLPLGRRVPSAGPRGVKLDARYHRRGGGSDRLEIINRGSEAVYDVDVEVPEMPGLQVHSGDLPKERLPAGKSFQLMVLRTMGKAKDSFDVVITGRTEHGVAVREEAFVDTVG
jgi:predicted nucleotide-binding protein